MSAYQRQKKAYTLRGGQEKKEEEKKNNAKNKSYILSLAKGTFYELHGVVDTITAEVNTTHLTNTMELILWKKSVHKIK